MCKLHVKKQFVGDLKQLNASGQGVQDAFFVRKVVKEGDDKAKYIVTLSDRTGSINGIIWQEAMKDVHLLMDNEMVIVTGKVNIFNNTPEINIATMELFDKQNYRYQVSDFCTSCIEDPESYYNSFLEQYSKDIKKPHLLKLLDSCYKNESCARRFRELQGSKAMHYVEMGGYMLRMVNIYNLCKTIASTYQLHPNFDLEILLTAAALSEIGKVKELRPLPYNQKTDAGYLLGHLALSLTMVSKLIGDIEDFPKEDELKLLHCILTAHGSHDKTVKPATIEAQILSNVEMLDSRIDAFNTLIVNDTTPGNMTKYSVVYDQFVYKK